VYIYNYAISTQSISIFKQLKVIFSINKCRIFTITQIIYSSSIVNRHGLKSRLELILVLFIQMLSTLSWFWRVCGHQRGN